MENRIISGNSIRMFTFFVTIVTYMLAGCMPTGGGSDSITHTETPSFGESETAEAPSSEVTPTSDCELNNIGIVDYDDQTNLLDFGWSETGGFFYQTEDGWWEFSIETHVTSLVANSNFNDDPKIPEFVEVHLAELREDEIRNHISLSPSYKKALYWVSSDESTLPIPSPNPMDLITEYDFPYDLFLFQENSDSPLYIGRIDYPVKTVYWLADEEEILLEMSGVGELSAPRYWLWSVDTRTQSIAPLLAGELLQSPKFRILDVSLDGDWAMYQTSAFDYVTIVNLDNGEIRPLYSVPPGIGAWWLPDGERIVTVLNAGPGYYSVYLYDTVTEELNRIASDINYEGLTAVFVEISPNRKFIAFLINVTPGPDEMFLIELCLEP